MHTVHVGSVFPGVNLTCVQTDKFKTGCLSINLISSLSHNTAAQLALMPRVLRRGSDELADMERISSALDDLYGARIEPTVRKKGELHCVGFHVDFPDGRFIPDGSLLLEKTVSLASGILLSPVMQDNLMRQDYIDSEKKNLIDDIRAGINDKRSYSIDRLLENMCENEAYSINRLGSEADAGAITPESLTAQYRKQLTDSKVELLYCGSADPARVTDALHSALHSLPGRKDLKTPETEIVLYPPHDTPRRISETLDVSQGKLAAGFRLGKAMRNVPDYPAMMVFNAVYGSGVTSKLFVNVREKLALCYYASSIIDKHKGVMVVSSGVEFSKFDIALDEIVAQLGHVKRGDISTDELLSAKRSITTSIQSAMDRPSGLLELYFDSSLAAVRYDPDKLCDMVSAVTLERVVEVASEIEMDTVYFLRGEASEGAAINGLLSERGEEESPQSMGGEDGV